MTDTNDTADETASKPDNDELRAEYEAEREIDRWLAGPRLAAASESINIASHARPYMQQQPERDELSDVDRESIGAEAFRRWKNERKNSPKVYAARALATWRNRGKGRFADFDPDLMGADVDASSPEDRAEAREMLEVPEPPQTFTVQLQDLREIAPDDLTDAALLYRTEELAGLWLLAARKRGDEHAGNMGKILLAAADMYHRDRAALAHTMGRVANTHLKRNNRGPRTRLQEIEGLLSVVRDEDQHGRKRHTPAPELAERVVRWMRCYPKLAADAPRLPVTGQPWAEEERKKVVADVARVLAADDNPENLARDIMRALGYRAKNLLAGLAKRKTPTG